MHSYLLNRRGNYHFRIRIPSDLSYALPSAEIVKSLKTRDQSEAQATSLSYLHGITKIFSLLRSGYISGEQARESIDRLIKRKPSNRHPHRPIFPIQLPPNASEPSAVMPPPPISHIADYPLASVIRQFIEDKKHGWGPKTKLENECSYRLMVDLLGNIGVGDIDRLRVRDLRTKLMKLPANVYKLFPKKTASSVLETLAGTNTPTMSITTVNKHISRLSSLMKFCNKEGYTDGNPALGLKIKQKRRPYEERKAYSKWDLQSIVSNLPAKDGRKPERYWIPLIGMLSGLRLDEACQLYTEDVKEIDGVLCFDVNDDGDKKLKTLSSKRIVPIHPTLITLGFIGYVASIKAAGQHRLWMNLHRRKEDGYGNAFGKWFQRFNRQHVTSDPLKSFHSLRHTFADALKQQAEQEALIAELMGHSNPSITTGRYGKRYNDLSPENSAIAKLVVSV